MVKFVLAQLVVIITQTANQVLGTDRPKEQSTKRRPAKYPVMEEKFVTSGTAKDRPGRATTYLLCPATDIKNPQLINLYNKHNSGRSIPVWC